MRSRLRTNMWHDTKGCKDLAFERAVEPGVQRRAASVATLEQDLAAQHACLLPFTLYFLPSYPSLFLDLYLYLYSPYLLALPLPFTFYQKRQDQMQQVTDAIAHVRIQEEEVGDR